MFERVIKFFKSRRTVTTVQPKIEVDYVSFSYDDNIKLQLQKQWEALLKELESDPSIVKSRKWSMTHHDGTHKEEIVLDIDGVIIALDGPYYPDPDWKKPLSEPPKTETERGNEAVDVVMRATDMLWAVTHCSDRKFEALIEFLKATRGSSRSEL